MEPVKHLSRSLLWKTSTSYSRKQFLQKFPLRRFKGSCIIPTFLMNPTPPTINSSPKSLDLKQNTRLLLNNHLPHPRIKLGRIKIFKTSFRKLSTKICESCIWQAVGGSGVILFALLWRNEYENRDETHPLKKQNRYIYWVSHWLRKIHSPRHLRNLAKIFNLKQKTKSNTSSYYRKIKFSLFKKTVYGSFK